MKLSLIGAFLATTLSLGTPSFVLAEPIENSDGSKTCNASGPSGAGPGICANDLATNEGYCDGGMSSEPGGGTTCSEPRRAHQPKLKTAAKQ